LVICNIAECSFLDQRHIRDEKYFLNNLEPRCVIKRVKTKKNSFHELLAFNHQLFYMKRTEAGKFFPCGGEHFDYSVKEDA
jgi:hypothetical protein